MKKQDLELYTDYRIIFFGQVSYDYVTRYLSPEKLGSKDLLFFVAKLKSRVAAYWFWFRNECLSRPSCYDYLEVKLRYLLKSDLS